MITDALAGEHPKHLLATGRRAEFLDRMSASVLRITQAFAPARGLPCGRLPHQRVPRAVRRRGVRARRGEPDDRVPRLLPVHPRPELFALDLDVIARVREQTPTCT